MSHAISSFQHVKEAAHVTCLSAACVFVSHHMSAAHVTCFKLSAVSAAPLVWLANDNPQLLVRVGEYEAVGRHVSLIQVIKAWVIRH
uniref:Putative secreted protein n=1 Tax=Amblyomma cajennense TaxID=34607 RepID=A0A023FD65_AMBCJ